MADKMEAETFTAVLHTSVFFSFSSSSFYFYDRAVTAEQFDVNVNRGTKGNSKALQPSVFKSTKWNTNGSKMSA